MSIKVSIADDHPIVTNGLVKILQDFENIKVLDKYASGKALLEGLKLQQPDILLLDMQLPDGEGPDLAKKVLKDFPAIKIIVLTSNDIIAQVKKMLQLGCYGYLLKDSEDTVIVEAIETVYQGGQFLSPQLQQRLVDDMFRNKQDKKHAALTRREKEILQLITAELTNQEIADKLFISLHTVENHRSSLLQKLQVKNTAGLVRKAIEYGLIDA